MGQFTAVAVTCAVALILQCALLLYTTYAKSINTVAALVIIIIVEVLPGLVRCSLLFTRMTVISNTIRAGSCLQRASAARDERVARHRVVLLLSRGVHRVELEHGQHRHREQRRERCPQPSPRRHRKHCQCKHERHVSLKSHKLSGSKDIFRSKCSEVTRHERWQVSCISRPRSTRGSVTNAPGSNGPAHA